MIASGSACCLLGRIDEKLDKVHQRYQTSAATGSPSGLQDPDSSDASTTSRSDEKREYLRSISNQVGAVVGSQPLWWRRPVWYSPKAGATTLFAALFMRAPGPMRPVNSPAKNWTRETGFKPPSTAFRLPTRGPRSSEIMLDLPGNRNGNCSTYAAGNEFVPRPTTSGRC